MYKFRIHLRHRNNNYEALKFVIFQDPNVKPLATVSITTKVTEAMMRDHVFDVGWVKFQVKNRLLPTQIYLSFGETSMYPISGSPRCFTQDNELASPRFTMPGAVSYLIISSLHPWLSTS
jgi:hypothetical protein